MSSQLTYAYNSLTYQLPDRMKQSIGVFMAGYVKVLLKMHKKVYYISQIFANYPGLN